MLHRVIATAVTVPVTATSLSTASGSAAVLLAPVAVALRAALSVFHCRLPGPMPGGKGLVLTLLTAALLPVAAHLATQLLGGRGQALGDSGF